MLATETPFPHTGSIGFIAKTAEPAKILQACSDGTMLVQRLRRAPGGGLIALPGATANRRVDASDLFADVDTAMHGSKEAATKARRRRAAGGR